MEKTEDNRCSSFHRKKYETGLLKNSGYDAANAIFY